MTHWIAAADQVGLESGLRSVVGSILIILLLIAAFIWWLRR